MDNYSKKFRHALALTLSHEGGYVHNLDDPGGATKFGISLRTLSSLNNVDQDSDGVSDYDFNGDGAVNVNDIVDADAADAKFFYYQEFWDKYSYEKLPFGVAAKTFDLSVNMGPRQAHLILQRALMANGQSLKDDGVLGNITFTLAKTTNEDGLMAAICSEAAGFYRLLAAINPTSKQFLKGWLRRAYS